MENHVALHITLPAFHERPVTFNRFFKEIFSALNHLCGLGLTGNKDITVFVKSDGFSTQFDQSSNACRGIKTCYASATRSALFHQGSLGDELYIYFSVQKLPLQFVVPTDVAADYARNLSILDHKPQAKVVSSPFVA